MTEAQHKGTIGTGRDPFEGLKISPQMQRMLTAHADMSLASANGLASVLRIGPTNIYPLLDWKLDDDNRSRPMSSTKIGATLAKKDYFWLNDLGRRILDDLRPVWHEEWARCGILGRLQLAEWCPQAVGSLIPQMGQLRFFSWVQGKGADAVAVFEEGIGTPLSPRARWRAWGGASANLHCRRQPGPRTAWSHVSPSASTGSRKASTRAAHEWPG